MNTIGDKQNEKYFYSHYNEFEYKHDYNKNILTCKKACTWIIIKLF